MKKLHLIPFIILIFSCSSSEFSEETCESSPQLGRVLAYQEEVGQPRNILDSLSILGKPIEDVMVEKHKVTVHPDPGGCCWFPTSTDLVNSVKTDSNGLFEHQVNCNTTYTYKLDLDNTDYDIDYRITVEDMMSYIIFNQKPHLFRFRSKDSAVNLEHDSIRYKIVHPICGQRSQLFSPRSGRNEFAGTELYTYCMENINLELLYSYGINEAWSTYPFYSGESELSLHDIFIDL